MGYFNFDPNSFFSEALLPQLAICYELIHDQAMTSRCRKLGNLLCKNVEIIKIKHKAKMLPGAICKYFHALGQ